MSSVIDEPKSAVAATTGTAVERELPGLEKVVSSLPVDHSGSTVYLKGWRLASSTRPPVIVVHDLAEHADLYRKTTEAFAAAGYSCYVFDLRGHGRSGRRLGHAPSFAALVHDLLQVAAWVRHKESGRAPVIVGQGVGAVIAMEFARQHASYCRAAVLSAPCLELASDVGPISRILLRIVAEIAPTLRIPSFLCPRFARELGNAARGDGEDNTQIVRFPRLTAIFAHELLLSIERAEARFAEHQGQALVVCPAQDRIFSYGRVKRTAALHKEPLLRLVELDGVGHHVFTGEDTSRDAAMKAILAWLESGDSNRQREEIRLQGASRADADMEKPGATKD